MARKVVLAGACRTAIGTMGGSLSTTPAVELGALVIKEALNRGYYLALLGLCWATVSCAAAAGLGGFSTDGGKGSVIGATISQLIFGVVKFGLGNIFSFPDSAVNLSVGVILILSVLVPNLVEDIQNRRKVAQRRAETAKLNAGKA